MDYNEETRAGHSEESDAIADGTTGVGSAVVPSTFRSGLRFGLGFALAMLPLLAVFFVGAYFMSRPASQNAAVPIERVANNTLIRMNIALNEMIERIREIIEATVQRIFENADVFTAVNIPRVGTEVQEILDRTVEQVDENTAAAIESVQQITSETLTRIDASTEATIQTTSALMEQQFNRFTNTSIETWRVNTDELITRVIQLLDDQAVKLAELFAQLLRGSIGGILTR